MWLRQSLPLIPPLTQRNLKQPTCLVNIVRVVGESIAGTRRLQESGGRRANMSEEELRVDLVVCLFASSDFEN
jgi:hypothetical protein